MVPQTLISFSQKLVYTGRSTNSQIAAVTSEFHLQKHNLCYGGVVKEYSQKLSQTQIL